jgi:hypothetical protein
MLKAVTNLVNVSQITGVLPVVNGGTGVTTSTGTGNTVLSAAPTLSGNVSLSTGNLIISTAGKGIDFAATSGTGTSELLADYEEGTWTPTLIGDATNPTVTYSLQRGIYTKVGRVVTVSVYLAWSAFSGGSGNVGFGNLPFTIESSVGSSFAGSISLLDGFTLSAARTSVGLLGAGGTTYSLPTCFGSAVSPQYIAVGSVAASGLVQYTLTYSV